MAEASQLFTQPQVRFHIVHSDKLPAEEIHWLTELLTEGGAIPAPSHSSQEYKEIDLETTTHIITRTVDFPDFEAAAEPSLGKSIVTPEWATASLSKRRQANPRQYSADPRMFFSGLIVCCASDLPEGDKDAIVGYVLAVGGLYSSAVTKQVTHIVALTTESEKCKIALGKNLNCKIVLPHWIDDCLKIRARLIEEPYCLPNPKILQNGTSEKPPDAHRNDLRGSSTAQPQQLPTLQKPSLTIFKSKTVMLAADLGINSRLRGTIEDLITDGGGSMTGSVHKADYLVCQHRESRDYRVASRAGKTVGSLAWLYHLITHNAWTSPMRRLLHYPISRQGIPGFKPFRISVSNYNGEARIYLENLAIAAGAEFTKTMKDDNTHLITAHPNSEKCNAAKEWNIHIVNHLWLEESYAQWQVQTISKSTYTQFPNRTNLGEIVGQTEIDKRAVERHFFPAGSDVRDIEEDEPVHKQKAGKTLEIGPAKTAQDASAVLVPLPSDGTTPRASKANRRHTDGETLQTPANPRGRKIGKENETPSTTGSRSAKAMAAAKLQNLAPDIALFEKESKRVGGVIHGGRKKTDDLVQNGQRKRSKSMDENADAGTEEDTKAAKRKKTSGLPPVVIRVLLSGYKRWVGQTAKIETEERSQLRELGILVVADPSKCTHLASPHVVRTRKFLCAIAHGPSIISTNFIDDCLGSNRCLDPNEYLLHDQAYEKQSGYRLADALFRAKANKGHLLKGCTIYCTESVHGGPDTYKAITEANGGKWMLYRARAGSNQVLRAGSVEVPSDTEAKPEHIYLVSGTTPEEGKLWQRFRQMADSNNKIAKIVRHDWLLQMALSQHILSGDSYALTDKDIGTSVI
ncbi:uncharacterized protein KY384_002130 [Bacidia gigantensis]|uniref:uncharacterized protein n=1 Tax=Bacidia gigantensis TaxID=2732470 RepID=UPI001D052050|nr:uncharacterized protein KY384_002130 [Bacidia gigantensis]KAG8533347.1 hypothetical protein KY384_002130 [Bacidia gigantensis]